MSVWAQLSERERGRRSAGSRSRALAPGNGGGLPARRKRARGAPVDGRRFGPSATCFLTQAWCNRLLPAGACPGGDEERQRSGFERCERLRTPPQRSTPPGGVLLSTQPARRASNARSKLEARVKRASTCAEGAAKRSPARESSGSSGARAVGRLQKSVRSIFPRCRSARKGDGGAG